MIYGLAKECFTHFRHCAVTVSVEATETGYLVTLEETWTKLGSLQLIEPQKRVSEEVASLEAFFKKADDSYDGFVALGEKAGISQELLDDAMRDVMERIENALLFSGAAHYAYDGSITIDCDEETCRRVIRDADREDDNGDDQDDDDVA